MLLRLSVAYSNRAFVQFHLKQYMVREKIELARKESEIIDRLGYLEKVIKKSHAVIVDKLSGSA